MTADYQQLRDAMTGGVSDTVLRYRDSAYIPPDPANRDRQEYERYIAEGGETDPAPSLPEPPPPTPLTLSAHPEGDMDAATKGYTDTLVTTETAPLTERVEALEARMAAMERRAVSRG